MIPRIGCPLVISDIFWIIQILHIEYMGSGEAEVIFIDLVIHDNVFTVVC